MSKFDSWKRPIRVSLGEKSKRIRPPRGTFWRLDPGFERITLKAHYQFEPGQSLVIIAACSFFIAVCIFVMFGICGITPDFVKKPEWEPQIWIIIPIFGLLGFFLLFLTYIIIRTILEAVQSEIWIFSKGTARYGYRFFGIGILKKRSISDLAAMEIRLVNADICDDELENMRKNGMHFELELEWCLVFLDENGNEILIMPRLDKEEARWIMDAILHEQRNIV